jgi:hypothetical protein
LDSLEGITGSFATTGSNSFIGNQIITGSLLISSSAAIDLIVTGAMGITGTMTSSGSNGQAALANIALTITSNAQSSSATYGRNVMRQTSGSNAMGMAANPNQGSWVVGVTDPSIISFSGSAGVGNYYAPIRFQSGDQYTDGRVTFQTPIVGLQNLELTGSLTASLANGFTYVGDANNKTTLVATSSFGTPIPTGTISGSSQITALGFVSSSVTASSIITASVAGNVLTFTEGDGTTFSLTVATGSGGGGAAFPYTGSAEITGSLGITGSFRGYVNALSVASSTASIDMVNGNFFTLNLPTSSTTHIAITNIKAGQTINLQVSQSSANTGSIAFAPNIKFAGGFDYTATAITGALDLVSFIAFDSNQILATSVKNLL